MTTRNPYSRFSTTGLIILALSWFGISMAQAQNSHALPAPQGKVIFEVQGDISHTNVDGIAAFDRHMLEELLPSAHLETHTSVTDGVHQFDGFWARDLMKLVGANGKTVVLTALNDYVIELPIDEFEKYDVMVAHTMDGKPLRPSDKGPLWIVYPRDRHKELQSIRYDYRWVWQLVRMDIL